MDFDFYRFVVKLFKPYDLLSGILVYALGVSIARYLGNPIDWAMVILGQFWVTILQIGSHLLEAYFHHTKKPGDISRFYIESKGDEIHEGIRRDYVLWSAFAAFAALVSLTLVFIQNKTVNFTGLTLMGFLFLGSILYSVPPFQLLSSGLGELTRSILVASFIPALGFIIQTGEIHRLVAMVTFPSTILHLAMTLALQLQNYSTNLKLKRNILLVRIGWERGMALNNILILSSFLLIGIAMLFGLPISIALPAYTVLPLGIFQIWYVSRIAAGIKPNWRVLNLTAVLTFSLTVYLLLFSFLTR